MRGVCAFMIWTLVALTGLPLFAVDALEDSLVDPPDAAKQAVVLRQVREAYKALYQAKGAAGSKVLAIKLLESEATFTSEPETRYVMLVEARGAAIEAGEFELVLQAISITASNYRVDAASLKAEALTEMRRTLTTESAGAYAETALGFAQQFLKKDDITQGIKLIALAESAFRRVKDAVALESLRADLRTTKELLGLVRRYGMMNTKLLQDAENESAIAMVGKYDYLVKKDRKRGLSVWARSKVAELKTIAELEQKTIRTPAEWGVLGDAWLKLAKTEAATVFREPMAKRAIYWYEQAVTQTTALREKIIRNNIREAYKAAGLPAGYEKLTEAEREGLIRYRDKWFLLVKIPLVWENAAKWCSDRNGTLALVRSSSENEFLWQLVKEAFPNNNNPWVWLGGTDKKKEGVWRWQDGSLMTYRNWDKGQPDNGIAGEHYTHYIFNRGRWNDHPGSDRMFFFAQWKMK